MNIQMFQLIICTYNKSQSVYFFQTGKKNPRHVPQRTLGTHEFPTVFMTINSHTYTNTYLYKSLPYLQQKKKKHQNPAHLFCKSSWLLSTAFSSFVKTFVYLYI